MALERPDLKPLVGRKLTIIAWLWARTVKSPNPAFRHVDVPLVSRFTLASKVGKEAYVDPCVGPAGYTFAVKVGKPQHPEKTERGTKVGSSGSSFFCLMSGTPMAFEYLREEAKAGRMGSKLMAIVCEGEGGRIYLSPTSEMEALAHSAVPKDVPETELPVRALGFRVQEYGMSRWRDLFTKRQLTAVTAFGDLVQEVRQRVMDDLVATIGEREVPSSSTSTDSTPENSSNTLYASAVCLYLAFNLDRLMMQFTTLSVWSSHPAHELVVTMFSRQTLSMTWDYGELNPFCTAASWEKCLDFLCKPLASFGGESSQKDGWVQMADAQSQSISAEKVVSTDPPYYDNIGYADLSDFFYVWLRRSLKLDFPELFDTVAVPKTAELIATPFRHSSKDAAEAFFLNGMTHAMQRLSEQSHPAFPVTIYYAFKQSETDSVAGTSSTGWETFLDAVIRAGFALSGTWPVRTERATRSVGLGTNALASSIVLVCRPRSADAPVATRREFVAALQRELPEALRHLQAGNIAPVDLAQAAIGPGMAVFTRYAQVLDAQGKAMRVREALALINETLDTALAEQEGDFDPDSRWALAWFEQFGFEEGQYGVAETLSKAKNTSISGLADAGILHSSRGKVRLLPPSELPSSWDPAADTRLMHWETVHHLIRALNTGEVAASELLTAIRKVDLARADAAREFAYRLYSICERKKRAADALSYNALVQAWPELTRLGQDAVHAPRMEDGQLL